MAQQDPKAQKVKLVQLARRDLLGMKDYLDLMVTVVNQVLLDLWENKDPLDKLDQKDQKDLVGHRDKLAHRDQ